MIFHKQGDYWAISECGRYSISRANNLGGGSYQCARLGSKRVGKAGESWDGSVLLHSARYVEEKEGDRVAAFRACVSACQADAARPQSTTEVADGR